MKTILPFLRDLKEHNDRDWFLANKKRYEKAKAELSETLTETISGISGFDSGIAGLQPKDCLFRINRDIRFSNDKSPYKTNMGAVIAPGGRKSKYACYYIHIDPEASFLAGGIYMPEPDVLARLRQEIDYNLDEFKQILDTQSFKKYFKVVDDNGRLKTTPKGYDAANPAIEYLKNKSFTVHTPLSTAEIESGKLSQKALSVFKEMYIFNRFLNRAVDTT